MTIQSSKVNLVNYNNGKLGFTVNAENISFDDNSVSFDHVVSVYGEKVRKEFDQVESVKDYGKSIYIYARDVVTNDKFRIVIYK